MKNERFKECLLFIGFLLLISGIALINKPAALISAGVIFMYLGLPPKKAPPRRER